MFRIFEPIFVEMSEFEQALEVEDFINAACKLYNTLCVSDKNEVLKLGCEKKATQAGCYQFQVMPGISF